MAGGGAVHAGSLAVLPERWLPHEHSATAPVSQGYPAHELNGRCPTNGSIMSRTAVCLDRCRCQRRGLEDSVTKVTHALVIDPLGVNSLR